MSASWPTARIRVSAASVSNFPVGCGKPLSSSSMTSTVISGPSKAVMVCSQLMRDALTLGFVGLVLVGGHLGPGPAVDDQRLVGAEPAGDPGRVHRGVAAAVHRDPAAQHRVPARGDVAQERHRVHDPGGVPGRDVHVLGQVRTHRHEHRVETPRGPLGRQVGDRGARR